MSEADLKRFTEAVAALEIDNASKLLFSGLLIIFWRGFILHDARLIGSSSFGRDGGICCPV